MIIKAAICQISISQLASVAEQTGALPGPRLIKNHELSTKFILLINVEMSTIVGILTIISIINTPQTQITKKVHKRNTALENYWEALQRIRSKCHLISSLPGNASRTLVDIARLAERLNMRFRSLAW